MTKQILFMQGGGAGAHDDWDSKLVASLRHDRISTIQRRHRQFRQFHGDLPTRMDARRAPDGSLWNATAL